MRSFLILFFSVIISVNCLDNGLGLTPPMVYIIL